jgi:hypothetical protein
MRIEKQDFQILDLLFEAFWILRQGTHELEEVEEDTTHGFLQVEGAVESPGCFS